MVPLLPGAVRVLKQKTESLRGARALVTGATGFMGAHLVRRLNEIGATPLPLPGRESTGRMIDERRLAPFVKELRPDVIFHLAAETRRDAAPEDYYRSNVELTAELCEAARAVPSLRRFVHAGTCGEYGNVPSPLREDGPSQPRDLYGESRLEATLLALDAHERRGLPVTVARIFLTFGPGQRGPLFMPSIFQAVAEGRPVDLTGGEQSRDFVYVEDVVEALLLLCVSEDAVGRIVNVASGVARTLRDVGEECLRAFGETRRDLLRFGALPYRGNEPMVFFADVSRQERTLGFAERTPFADAMSRTARSYRVAPR